MIGKKKPSVVEPRQPPPRPQTALRIPVVVLVRMFLIGSVAVLASIWAIWRHYTVPRPSMLMPGPNSSSAPPGGQSAPSGSPTEIEIETTPLPGPTPR